MSPNGKVILLTRVPVTERTFAEGALPRSLMFAESFPEVPGPVRGETRVLCVSYADQVPADLLASMPNLQAVITRSDGYDHLPLDALRARGIAAYHLGDYAVEAVAQHTLLFILALLKRVPEATARTRDGSWDRAGLTGRALHDVTVGLLGTGRIGTRVAHLVHASGGRMVAFDITPDIELERQIPGFGYVPHLDDLLAASDVLTLHVPLTEETRGLIGGHAIHRMPGGALLVNTARGDVVDAEAVARALSDGRLGGYAADVLSGEPHPLEDLARFRGLPNVLLTPHVAAYDAGTLRERYERTARVARAVLDGREEDVARLRVA